MWVSQQTTPHIIEECVHSQRFCLQIPFPRLAGRHDKRAVTCRGASEQRRRLAVSSRSLRCSLWEWQRVVILVDTSELWLLWCPHAGAALACRGAPAANGCPPPA